jgi:hypothetical protein
MGKTRKNAHEHFEDVYLRSSYLERIKPEQTGLFSQFHHEYKNTIDILALRYYRRNTSFFKTVGFEPKDIYNFCNIQAWSFIENFSIVANDSAMRSFLRKRAEKYSDRDYPPTAEEITKKDKSNFIFFLNQRLSDLVRISKAKIRNIRGTKEISSFFEQINPNLDTELVLEIARDPKKYGYRELSNTEVVALKKEMKKDFRYEDFSHKSKKYKYISYKNFLSKDDAVDLFHGPHTNMFYLRPDQFSEFEDELAQSEKITMMVSEFKSLRSEDKIKVLKQRKKALPSSEKKLKSIINQKIVELSGG